MIRTIADLELGALYAVCGEGESVEMLPPQVFRYESLAYGTTNGTPIIQGTMWWRAWVAGKWYSGVLKDHFFYAHHVGLSPGSMSSSKHDFHFEKIDRRDIPKHLGKGLLYAEFMQDERRRIARSN